MKNFAAVMLFSLVTIGFFTWFSNFGIPQLDPAPPPKEEKLDLGAMTMEQFTALGERIYKGKGTCTLCHNAVGGRAPLLEEAASVAKERVADERYKGEAEDMVGYLYESLVKPSAFVVVGFGKAGSSDTVSPMPDVSGGSIGLSEAEMTAIVAYLQQLGGFEVTVEIPKDAAPDTEEEATSREPFKTVEEAMAEFACGACHKVAEEEGDVGPDLRNIGKLRDRAHLRRSILDPNAEISKGFEKDQMPADYGAQMYAKELEMIVDYLAALK
jgi:mono/diheme cytochrome c family protein